MSYSLGYYDSDIHHAILAENTARRLGEFANVERLVYTVKEAVALLGISLHVAYQAAREGTLPTVRLSRRVLVPRKALLAMLDTGKPDAATAEGRHAEHERVI